MRGIQIRITVDLLLELIGLERGKIQLGAAAIDTYMPDTLVLVLRGEDKRLPKIKKLEPYPRGIVICERMPNKPEIQGRIVAE